MEAFIAIVIALSQGIHDTVTGIEQKAHVLQEEHISGARTASGQPVLVEVNGLLVNQSIASMTRALVAAAQADGVALIGTSGYRSRDEQISLRRTNCGPTNYDIFQKPEGQCRPPTSLPGDSMHEKGLAIDFKNCSTRLTSCYKWLEQNAATYGFINRSDEPWHWSTTGH